MPLNSPIRDTMNSDPTPITSIWMKDVVGVVGAPEDIPDRPDTQQNKFLKRLDGRF